MKENKDVIVWDYVMFVLAGWFQTFPKEDVMKRAVESERHMVRKIAMMLAMKMKMLMDKGRIMMMMLMVPGIRGG